MRTTEHVSTVESFISTFIYLLYQSDVHNSSRVGNTWILQKLTSESVHVHMETSHESLPSPKRVSSTINCNREDCMYPWYIQYIHPTRNYIHTYTYNSFQCQTLIQSSEVRALIKNFGHRTTCTKSRKFLLAILLNY